MLFSLRRSLAAIVGTSVLLSHTAALPLAAEEQGSGSCKKTKVAVLYVGS